MYEWLKIALAAYLVGALIEGVITVKQLHGSLPALVKSGKDEPPPDSQPRENWLVLVVVTAVSIGGAFSWPCRLIHRSMKE